MSTKTAAAPMDRPTEELEQHYGIKKPQGRGRAAHEILSRVTLLLGDGEITRAELRACHRWRDDWDVGMAGVRQGGGATERIDCAQGDAYSEVRLDALGRLRQVSEALGRFAVWMLERSVCDDWPYAQLGRTLGVRDETAKSWVVAVIKGLGAFYAVADQCKRRNVAFSVVQESESGGRHGKLPTIEQD